MKKSESDLELESKSGVPKIQESASEVLCTDSTSLTISTITEATATITVLLTHTLHVHDKNL
jgi:hypothetical protein